jgi:hypothetical protein
MAIDDIKPAASFGQKDYPTSEVAGDGKPNRTFADVQRASAALAFGASGSQVGNLRKSDLDDPSKADLAVRSCSADLVDSQTTNLPLSVADKKTLSNFVSEDPLMRQKVETYLRKVLP